jgi:hypothetical protein
MSKPSKGNALWRLGERESSSNKLEEAIEAYREALKERTRERVPLDWALTTGSLVLVDKVGPFIIRGTFHSIPMRRSTRNHPT